MTSRSLPAALRRSLTFWRRSIQARVVVSTVLLSAAVISIVGWFLLQQTREGLLDNRVSAVVAEANNETVEARDRLAAAPGTDIDSVAQQQDLVEPIIQRGETRGFSVVMSGPVESGARIEDGGARSTLDLDTSSVPVSLEEHFDEPAGTAWTYTKIRTPRGRTTRSTPSRGSSSAPRSGSRPTGRPTRCTTCSPSSEQQETLALVTRALLTAALLLLVLVAGVTWLVTRQVVTPIRLARRVAERLAAGQLQERLRVTGEDDLARLATSFNQMATSLQRQIRQLEELSRVQRRFVSDVSHELRTPADHGPHGRRRAARRARATSTRPPPGPPSCCRPSSTGSRRCSSTCSRSAGSTPVRPSSRPTTSTWSTSPTGSST